MTTVTFNKTDNTYEVIVDGHTDPIVCSGISAIIYGLYGCLKNGYGAWKHEELKDGYVHISFASGSYKVKEDFKFAYISLKQIEAGYPEHIEVIGNVW